jgi:signal transduction histidine kinase
MLIVTGLTIATLTISIYTFNKQRIATGRMLKAYVADMAENYYENAPDSGSDHEHLNNPTEEFHHAKERQLFFQMFSAEPSMRSGGLLLFDENKRVIGGSVGAERLASLWNDALPLGEPSEARDPSGVLYHVIVRPLKNGHYVLVASSQSALTESMSGVWNFWLTWVILTSAAILAGIIVLWKYFVTPIRHIVGIIGNMQWGKEIPKLKPARFFEVAALQNVVEKSASDSVDKEQRHLRYVGDIVQAQEETGRRLAREIHDGPLQLVVATIKHIQLAQDVVPQGPAEERLNMAENISQFAAREIRHYCDELSPSWLALGLKSSLEEMASRLSAVYEIPINVIVNCKDDDISKDCSLSIIRILQEAVSNSARHGKATEINVQFARHNDEIVFEVMDNGCGFDVSEFDSYEKTRIEGHRGLSNMHERVKLLGGMLKIISEPGEGCAIRVYLRIEMVLEKK